MVWFQFRLFLSIHFRLGSLFYFFHSSILFFFCNTRLEDITLFVSAVNIWYWHHIRALHKIFSRCSEIFRTHPKFRSCALYKKGITSLSNSICSVLTYVERDPGHRQKGSKALDIIRVRSFSVFSLVSSE